MAALLHDAGTVSTARVREVYVQGPTVVFAKPRPRRSNGLGHRLDGRSVCQAMCGSVKS